jgi:Tol biopolymer transport system component
VFAPDGTDLREVTDHAAEDLEPDWSPDSTKIVFASRRQIPDATVVRKRLWIMGADGSNPTQYTAPFGTNTGGTTVEDHHPSWSPDGQEIAFSRSHQNNSRFVMVKHATSGAVAEVVTPLPTSNTDHTWDFPDWQPIPLP